MAFHLKRHPFHPLDSGLSKIRQRLPCAMTVRDSYGWRLFGTISPSCTSVNDYLYTIVPSPAEDCHPGSDILRCFSAFQWPDEELTTSETDHYYKVL